MLLSARRRQSSSFLPADCQLHAFQPSEWLNFLSTDCGIHGTVHLLLLRSAACGIPVLDFPHVTSDSHTSYDQRLQKPRSSRNNAARHKNSAQEGLCYFSFFADGALKSSPALRRPSPTADGVASRLAGASRSTPPTVFMLGRCSLAGRLDIGRDRG